MSNSTILQIGSTTIRPEVRDGYLHSLGSIQIGGVAVRNTLSRFLPWFDTYEGDAFRQFRLHDIARDGSTARVNLVAESDPDTMFRERRDSSGDPVFRRRSCDAPPIIANVCIAIQPAQMQ